MVMKVFRLLLATVAVASVATVISVATTAVNPSKAAAASECEFDSMSGPAGTRRYVGSTPFTCYFWAGVRTPGAGMVTGNTKAKFTTAGANTAFQLYAGHTIPLGMSWQDASNGWGQPRSCGSVQMPAGWAMWNPNTVTDCGYWVMGISIMGQIEVSDLVDWFGDTNTPALPGVVDQWNSPESVNSAICQQHGGCADTFMDLQGDGQVCSAATVPGYGVQPVWCSMEGGLNSTNGAWTSNTQYGAVASYNDGNWYQGYMDGYALNGTTWGWEQHVGQRTGGGVPTCLNYSNCPPNGLYTYMNLSLQSTGNLVVYTHAYCASMCAMWASLTHNTFDIPVTNTPGSYSPTGDSNGAAYPGAFERLLWVHKTGTPSAVNACATATTHWLGTPGWHPDNGWTSACTITYGPLVSQSNASNFTMPLAGWGGAAFVLAIVVEWTYVGAYNGVGASWTFKLADWPWEYIGLYPPGESGSISASPTTLTVKNSTSLTATFTNISDIPGTNNYDSMGIDTANLGPYAAYSTTSFGIANGSCSSQTNNGTPYTWFTCSTTWPSTATTQGPQTFSAVTSSRGALASTGVTWYQPTVAPAFSQSTAPSTGAGKCLITTTKAACPLNQALDIGLNSTWLDPAAPVDPATSFAIDKTAQTGSAPPATGRVLVGGSAAGTVPSPSTGSCPGQFSNRELYACAVSPGAGYHDSATAPSTQTVQAGLYAGTSTIPWLATTAALSWWEPPALSIVLSPTTTTQGAPITVSAKAAAQDGGSDAWYTPTTIYACNDTTDAVIAATTVAASTDPTAGGTISTTPVAVTQPTAGTQTFTAYDVETGSGYAPRLVVGASCSPLASGGTDAGWVLAHSAVTTARFTALLPT